MNLCQWTCQRCLMSVVYYDQPQLMCGCGAYMNREDDPGWDCGGYRLKVVKTL